MTTDDFCFYLQNRLIQTGQTGGQLYNDTLPAKSLLEIDDLSSIQMSFRRNVTSLCHDKKIVSCAKTFLDHVFHS